jgi:hypothetical protein
MYIAMYYRNMYFEIFFFHFDINFAEERMIINTYISNLLHKALLE